ncbi:MAG: toll/interleukin-1 receptor domain-containing protein [Anaerolineae bacterium]|nr:toll/interleukin-1 receptor domain-containing protein [Anaerolineae bacterium]
MQIFLSYASEDQDAARRLAQQLKRASHIVVMSLDLEKSGDDWQIALVACAAFIPLLSSSYEKSEVTKSQLMIARDAGIPVFPVLLRDVSNPLSRLPQWLVVLLGIMGAAGGLRPLNLVPIPPAIKIPWMLITLGITLVSRYNPKLPTSFMLKLRNFSSESDEPASPSEIAEEVAFTHFYPSIFGRHDEAAMHVYIHLVKLAEQIQIDLEYQNVARELHLSLTQQAAQPVTRGTRFTIVPRIPNVKVNPERADVTWIGDIEHLEFKMKVNEKIKDNVGLSGEVTIYMGGFVVATLPIVAKVGKQAKSSGAMSSDTQYPYKRLFISYSSRDRRVVELIDLFYQRYPYIETLIDFKFLRAGDEWQPTILQKIEEADALQLFWSENSATSENVRAEWQHALKLPRPIVPVHVHPKAGIPAELNHIHFEDIDSFLKHF